MENNELYHFGTKGMKWGIRRFQNEDGSLTEEGRRHYGYSLKRGIKNIREARQKKKLAKKRAKALEAARKARAEKRAHEAAKKKAVETGTAEEVLKYKNELTTKDKQDIYNRLQADENLARIADNEAKRRAEEAAKNSKWNKLKNVVSKVGDIGEMVNKAGSTYNATAKVINAFSDTKLPLIGEQQKTDPKSVKMAKEILSKYEDMSTAEKKEAVKQIEDLRVFESFANNNNANIPEQYKDSAKKTESMRRAEDLAKLYMDKKVSEEDFKKEMERIETLAELEQYASGKKNGGKKGKKNK